MATNNYKCTWIMNLGRQGWQEVWYWVGSSPQLALQAMIAVTPARIGLMNPMCIVDQLKVSDEAVLGDSLPNYQFQTTVPNPGTKLTRDVASTALLGRAFSNSVTLPSNQILQYQRPIELAGLPDEWVTFSPTNGAPGIPGTSLCPPAFLNAWLTWANKMLTNLFCLKVNDKTQPYKPVKTISVNPFTAVAGFSQGKILVNVPGHGLTPTNSQGNATTYRIKGCKFLQTFSDPKGLGPVDQHQRSIINRIQQWQDITPGGTPPALPEVNGVQVTTTDWLQLVWDLPVAFGTLIYQQGGTEQQRLWAYVPMFTLGQPVGPPNGFVVAERFNSRDRGRAYFVPRGRARKRVG
jgi:hypothetical protein